MMTKEIYRSYINNGSEKRIFYRSLKKEYCFDSGGIWMCLEKAKFTTTDFAGTEPNRDKIFAKAENESGRYNKMDLEALGD